MTDFEYGPVELILAGFDGDEPNGGVIGAVMDLVDAGTVCVLDLVFVSRSESGELTSMELEDAPDSLGLSALELSAGGLAAKEDLEQLGERLQPGTSAILLAIELLWAKHLASRLAEAGGFVIDALRIPAPVVNAVVAEARISH
jgi:hypothetical protein